MVGVQIPVHVDCCMVLCGGGRPEPPSGEHCLECLYYSKRGHGCGHGRGRGGDTLEGKVEGNASGDQR